MPNPSTLQRDAEPPSLTVRAHALASALTGRHYSEHPALILAVLRETVERCARVVLAGGDGKDRLETAIAHGPNAAIAEAILALLEEQAVPTIHDPKNHPPQSDLTVPPVLPTVTVPERRKSTSWENAYREYKPYVSGSPVQGQVEHLWSEVQTLTVERNALRAENGRLTDELAAFREKWQPTFLRDTPHERPKDCPSFRDGCNCTVAALEHNTHRAERAEKLVKDLEGEFNVLLTVIQQVHAEHADDICWMDIDRIFAAAGLPVPDRRVGDKAAMLRNCERFVNTMCAGGDWPSYRELEEELDAVREQYNPTFLRDAPHDTPGECPTYYDGCNCTVAVLTHNFRRAETAEKKAEDLKAERDRLDSELLYLCCAALAVLEDATNPAAWAEFILRVARGYGEKTSKLHSQAEAIRKAVAKQNSELFLSGDFTLHSGHRSAWKIDCDALSDADLTTLARMASEILPPFGSVEGVPTGGLRFAEALKTYATAGPVLIADDVLTTGRSLHAQRAGREEAIGVVIFARGECQAWVRVLFATNTSNEHAAVLLDRDAMVRANSALVDANATLRAEVARLRCEGLIREVES